MLPISFGRWIFLSSPRFKKMLGLYTIELTIADIPRQLVGLIGSRVINFIYVR